MANFKGIHNSQRLRKNPLEVHVACRLPFLRGPHGNSKLSNSPPVKKISGWVHMKAHTCHLALGMLRRKNTGAQESGREGRGRAREGGEGETERQGERVSQKKSLIIWFQSYFFPVSVMTSLTGSGVVPLRIFRVLRDRQKLFISLVLIFKYSASKDGL